MQMTHKLYLTFKPLGGATVAVNRIEACVAETRAWMHNDKLQPNDSKMEAMIICSDHKCFKMNISHIQIGDSRTEPAEALRDIGALLDGSLSMWQHVNSLCSGAHFYLHNTSKIRHLLDRTTVILVHAYVISHLDNGSALLFSLLETLLSRLQWVQNVAACLVSLTSWWDHITPVLHGLHWLLHRPSVAFRVLLLTYKALTTWPDTTVPGRPSVQILAHMITAVQRLTATDCHAVNCGPLVTDPLPVRLRNCETPSQLLSVLPPPSALLGRLLKPSFLV